MIADIIINYGVELLQEIVKINDVLLSFRRISADFRLKRPKIAEMGTLVSR